VVAGVDAAAQDAQPDEVVMTGLAMPHELQPIAGLQLLHALQLLHTPQLLQVLHGLL
jgi:hypothetical protein